MPFAIERGKDMNIPDSLLLVDDHPLFRNGLKFMILEALPGLRILEAGSIAEVRRQIAEEVPPAAVLDVTLPDGEGISLARELFERRPDIRIYILTMHRRSGLMIQARNAGCRGYFLKEGDGSSIVEALKTDTDRFLVSSQMEEMLQSADTETAVIKLYGELTRREKEVFRLYAEGLGYKEVAWKLGISPRTASVHRYNIFNKLEINSDVELVNAAREVGLTV